MNIIESNRLIAEFMAGGDSLYLQRDYITEQYYPFDSKELAFHTSWDWLMPVVEKCTQIGYRDQDFDSDIYQKWEETFDNQGMFLGNHIDEVYESVVEFIQWYNQKQTS